MVGSKGVPQRAILIQWYYDTEEGAIGYHSYDVKFS